MPLTRRPIIQKEKGAGSYEGGIYLGSDVWIVHASGVPTDGTSGDGAGFTGPGSLYINRAAAGTLYQNTGTKASPTWTAR